MAADLEIRRYRSSDREPVWSLHQRAIRETGVDAGDAYYDDLKQIETKYVEAGGEFLVGFVSEKLVAMGGLARLSAEEAEVKRMRVDPDFQRRGIGKALLEALEGRARQAGFLRIRVEATMQQQAARGLYANHGYAEKARYQVAGFDVIAYEKQLA